MKRMKPNPKPPQSPLSGGSKSYPPLIRGVRGVSDRKTFQIKTIADWDKLAKKILPILKPNTILALQGPLGAGKTTFVQALARALGTRSNPRSPTFSLLRTYKLSATSYKLTRLVHVDAYRIEQPEDLLALNLEEELAEPGTLIVIEWPENIASWLRKQKNISYLQIENKIDIRKIILTGQKPKNV